MLKKNKKQPFDFSSISALLQLCRKLNVSVDVTDDTAILAEPVKIGNLRLPNSLAVHPMECADGNLKGLPDKLTFRRYKRFAAGGAGLIWAESSAVSPDGRVNPHQLMVNKSNMETFSALIKESRLAAAESIGPKHIPVFVAQLTHSGRYSKPEPLLAQTGKYPPAAAENHKNSMPKILPDDYLDNLQNRFVEAARIAFEAGFDAVDIKSCHGYLINELFRCRDRQGRYGGSFENRTRFLLEVIDKIHDRLGEDKPVFVRLGVFDGVAYPCGWGVDENDYNKSDLSEPEKLIELLQARGVKMISITAGNPRHNHHTEHPLVGASRLLGLAGKIQKKFPHIAVVAAGYSWFRQLMGNVAAGSKKKGIATVIGAGRMALAYPDFARDIIINGKLNPARVCISCGACIRMMRNATAAGCPVRDKQIYEPITVTL